MSREEITRGPGIEAPEKNMSAAQLKAAESIIDGLGEISDDMILDADPYSPDSAASGYKKASAAAAARGSRRLRKALPALAACLGIFLGIGIALRGGIPDFAAPNSASGGAESVQMSTEAEVPEYADEEASTEADSDLSAEASDDVSAKADEVLKQSLTVEAPDTDLKGALQSDALNARGEEANEKEAGKEPSAEASAAFTADSAMPAEASGQSGKAASNGAGSSHAGTNESVMQTEAKLKTDLGFGQFETDLVNFIDAEGFRQKNYLFSPTSFKAALALAVSGAEGETKAQLLKASGFDSAAEMDSWYDSLDQAIRLFAERLDREKQEFEKNKQFMSPDAKAPDGAFEIANSVWHNADKPGMMKDSYKSYVAERYDAEANEADSGSITDKVNGWCDEKTHGMIPKIADDLSEEASVLINALYLRTSWLARFEEGFTQPGDFSCLDGTVVQKEFMRQRQKYAYYEDDDTQLVVMPMNGNVNAVFVLGSTQGLADKMAKAEYCEVIVKLPRFEVESSFDHQEFVDFLKARGADLPFRQDGSADFSAMCEGADWFISDIVQKAKIKLDEDGIEAAAVTAIMVRATSAMPQPEEPKEFTADRPFSFALVTGSEDPELLFYGQVVQ
ncbi:MAG: hypothetical protein IJM08_05780 [Firmicutes bacterium]|nr:hypothetical protein [Bacillota bacterium]